MIAFFAGRINITESSAAEWLAIGITIITVVVSGKYIGSSIIELMEMISWNQLEKEKHFVLILQDLLDRDFVIEQDVYIIKVLNKSDLGGWYSFRHLIGNF